jgi:hypothetical protein
MRRPAAFRVLVVPYIVDLGGWVAYALFRETRDPEGGWHALRGAPLRGETPLQAARRETRRLVGVPDDALYFSLDSRATIELPGIACPVVEHAFGVRVCEDEVRATADGCSPRWFRYETAVGLAAAADRDALWELHRRLGRPARCL